MPRSVLWLKNILLKDWIQQFPSKQLVSSKAWHHLDILWVGTSNQNLDPSGFCNQYFNPGTSFLIHSTDQCIMCELHEDDEPQAAVDSKGHKRNLSNGTADASPVRRSKRQRSTINLKEQSSSDESEGENDSKVTQAKPKQTKKSRAPSSSKKAESPEAKAVSDVTSVCKEPSEVKAEEDVTASTQKTKSTPAKRGKKTKEQKESEAMPLAPRTQGLKMFVGAHVSAAKGVYNSINNSEHIGLVSSETDSFEHELIML